MLNRKGLILIILLFIFSIPQLYAADLIPGCKGFNPDFEITSFLDTVNDNDVTRLKICNYEPNEKLTVEYRICRMGKCAENKQINNVTSNECLSGYQSYIAANPTDVVIKELTVNGRFIGNCMIPLTANSDECLAEGQIQCPASWMFPIMDQFNNIPGEYEVRLHNQLDYGVDGVQYMILNGDTVIKSEMDETWIGAHIYTSHTFTNLPPGPITKIKIAPILDYEMQDGSSSCTVYCPEITKEVSDTIIADDIPTTGNTCENVDLEISNFCYYTERDRAIFQADIKNNGISSPNYLMLVKGEKNVNSFKEITNPRFFGWGSWETINALSSENPKLLEKALQEGLVKDVENMDNSFLKSLNTNIFEKSAPLFYYKNFKNGKTINLKGVAFRENYGLLTYGDFMEISESPYFYFLPVEDFTETPSCFSNIRQVENITNCLTGEVIWQKPPETTVEKATKQIKGLIMDPFFYYPVLAIILLVGIFFFFKYKKPSFKKLKEKKLDIKPNKTQEKPKSNIPPSITNAISIKNLTVQYRRTKILDNVDINISRGDLVCLLGPAGTGKSTIMEAIVGRKKPTTGTIKVFDKNIKEKEVYNYVGFVPQGPEIYESQTVEQNLMSSAIKWGIKNPKEKIEEILPIVSLDQRRNLKASKLSGGQTKLLSLAMELIRDPELLILDEPTTGLDPNTRNNIITILSRLVTKQNKTVFFTTHYMDDAEECDEVIIIADGNIAAQGSPNKLERRLPGNGKIVNIILDNVTEELINNIKKIDGVKRVISEGRNIRIITDEPNAIKLGQKINEIGGIVNRTERINATMTEVFVYHTGKELEE